MGSAPCARSPSFLTNRPRLKSLAAMASAWPAVRRRSSRSTSAFAGAGFSLAVSAGKVTSRCHPVLAVCLTRDRLHADYTDLAYRLGRRLDKDMSTFGCHRDSEACGANVSACLSSFTHHDAHVLTAPYDARCAVQLYLPVHSAMHSLPTLCGDEEGKEEGPRMAGPIKYE